MAPLPPAVGVVKVTFVQTLSGRQFGDSLYFVSTDGSAWNMADLDALAFKCMTAYATNILPLQADNLVFDAAMVLDLSDDDGRQAISVSGAHGSSGGTMTLPLNCVAHIVFNPPRRYRGGRPGYNVSGLDMSMLADDKSFIPAQATVIDSAISTMIAQIVATELGFKALEHAVVSYVLAGAIRAVPLVLEPIAQEIQERICTLRRRLGKTIADIV
jgi:hypothetical protein